MFVEANPIPVKWALTEMGMMQSAIRLPMTNLSTEYQADVRQVLKSAKLI
jgi:4-hydroxy-tetrahydrodipicolinate synthase